MDPFAAVPHHLAECLRPLLDDVAAEVEREVQKHVPEYARPADDTYMKTIRAGVEQALTLFVDRIADPNKDWQPIAQTFHMIGRGEAVEGRSMDTLQAALRLGGRVAWRRFGQLADVLELEPNVLAALGEAAFVHIHEIAEAASAGYTEAGLRSTGELQRRRKRLLELLLNQSPASSEAVQDLAHAARWSLPRRVAVIALAGPPQDDDERLLLPAGVLADLSARPARLLVPDPDGPGPSRNRALALALRGRPAAVGPTVPLTDAADSLRWATRALSLMRRGLLATPQPGKGALRCADHLPTLLLYSDESLLRMLSTRVLTPLGSVPESQRDRLAETLLAWLQSGSSVGDVAARLHIHPQTVRYRLRQLEKLFGDCLREPETRFELELALRAEAASRNAAAARAPFRDAPGAPTNRARSEAPS
jgi:hypothetical protein